MFYIQKRNYLFINDWRDFPLEPAKTTLNEAAKRFWELRKVTGISSNIRVISREITPKGSVDTEVAHYKLLEFK